jgi:hypothetical protein
VWAREHEPFTARQQELGAEQRRLAQKARVEMARLLDDSLEQRLAEPLD